jgi:formylmethanofuran dehydrogenase subunit E
MNSPVSDENVCGRPLATFLAEIERFHGWQAPGILIGSFMVDWALEWLGPGVEADAIVETFHCLPDAVQLFTPCTIGNGWMKILDWDKFALSLYDRRTFEGVRLWLDLEKTQSFPNIYRWYMRLAPKHELPLEVLVDDILAARRAILSAAPIRATRLTDRKKKGATGVCPGCGEAFSLSQGERCLACQGRSYYTELATPSVR